MQDAAANCSPADRTLLKSILNNCKGHKNVDSIPMGDSFWDTSNVYHQMLNRDGGNDPNQLGFGPLIVLVGNTMGLVIILVC